MDHAPSPYLFQAAVELPLSLVCPDRNGQRECCDYRVTVITERAGLNQHDVVMDFRVLEAVLNSVLEPMHGHSLCELGMSEPLDMAKKIAQAILPAIKPPVKLAAVSLQDGAGGLISLQL